MNKISVALLLIVAFTCQAETPKSIRDRVDWQNGWYRVTASREGLVGHTTASGLKIKPTSKFVALPHSKALGRWVIVWYKDKAFVTTVEDVGPHSISDDYWYHNRRPLAEQGKRLPKEWGKARNPAGIDLSDGLWDWLGIPRGKGLVDIKWKFISMEGD